MHACLLRIYPDSLAIIAISRQAAESEDRFKSYLAGFALLSACLTFVVLTGLTPIEPTRQVVVSFLLINAATILLLVGIIIRNSIILVDFIELRVKDGLPLDQAIVDAGAVRFRPMALTAAAVVVGSAVILFDPIFQGLAISLMAGEVASLLLSRMAVPVLYYMAKRYEHHDQVTAATPIEVTP